MLTSPRMTRADHGLGEQDHAAAAMRGGDRGYGGRGKKKQKEARVGRGGEVKGKGKVQRNAVQNNNEKKKR